MKGRTKLVSIIVWLSLMVLIISNALWGNPISRCMAEKAAFAYIESNYADLSASLSVETVTYDAKTARYHAKVGSDGSVDTHFTVCVTMTGEVKWDSYDDVASGFNTFCRVDEAYSALVDGAMTGSELGYTLRWCVGGLEILDRQGATVGTRAYMYMDTLELDKDYDPCELGAQVGYISVNIQDETVSPERAAEILEDIKTRFDKAGVSFYGISLTLSSSGEENKSLRITDFPYSDIGTDDFMTLLYAEVDTK